jgi:hypothetical protein
VYMDTWIQYNSVPSCLPTGPCPNDAQPNRVRVGLGATNCRGTPGKKQEAERRGMSVFIVWLVGTTCTASMLVYVHFLPLRIPTR